LPCVYCATTAGRGTVSQRSLNGGRREVLRGIDALGILLRMSPEGPDDED
jgi:hypothetical protein